MTFEEICEINPRIAGLSYAASHVKDDKRERSFCANRIWYSTFKPVVVREVGWSAHDKRLTSPEVYDLVYETLYGLLPNCRHDSPFC